MRALGAIAAALVLGWAGTPHGLALFAIALAAASGLLLASERRPMQFAGGAVGVGAAVVYASAPEASPLWVVLLCFGALLALAPPLLRDLRHAVDLWPLKSGVLPESSPPDVDAVADRLSAG